MHKMEWDLVPFWDGLPRWLGYDHWDWGIAADWVAGIATVIAFIAAFRGISAERQRSQRGQAELVFVDLSPTRSVLEGRSPFSKDTTVTFSIRNESEHKIYNVRLIYPQGLRFVIADFIALLRDRVSVWNGKTTFRDYFSDFQRLLLQPRDQWRGREDFGDYESKQISGPSYGVNGGARKCLRCVVVMTDRHGRTWARRVGDGKYKRISKYRHAG
ncbi:hypothetical protein HQQ80_21670 [Microbacteriaceae bacterium VKM Ac-2855]|nr:hypothetical protein [Microbacteriaceae bacterium VKM Ac-2855]